MMPHMVLHEAQTHDACVAHTSYRRFGSLLGAACQRQVACVYGCWGDKPNRVMAMAATGRVRVRVIARVKVMTHGPLRKSNLLQKVVLVFREV